MRQDIISGVPVKARARMGVEVLSTFGFGIN